MHVSLINSITCGGSMGALIEAEGNGGTGTEKSRSENICTSSPVVYQLVRVGLDGQLVPATDDELMEVEHLFDDDRHQLQSVEPQRHTEQCPSELQKTSSLEGLSGMEVDAQNLNARLEDERLRLKCESVSYSPKDVNIGGKSSNHLTHSQSGNDDFLYVKTSLGTVGSPTCLNSSRRAQLESAETVSEVANDAGVSISSISDTHNSSEPDFSILKGEFCLDNLTMRELQEVFRATFGRQTSVKDKLWLKRRIAMGLTNSYEVQDTSIVIKDNKVVQGKVKEESCRVQQVMSEASLFPANQIGISDCSVNRDFGDSPKSLTNQINDKQVLPGKRPRQPPLKYDMKNENIQLEQHANKRTRKPTKRYIEELSEVETREAAGAVVSSVKDVGCHLQVSSKPQVRHVRDIGSQGTTIVTRKDSIGGCGIQIPYVSRMRRGRPRKDFYALMNFGCMDTDKRDREISYSEEEQDVGHEKINPAGNTSSENNGDTARADKARKMKVGVKRKHHRAWTLSEVLRLIEGVARYGAGRWSEIRRVAFASYSYRTSVDLKDKWRNLIRASLAQDPSDKGAKNFRKPTSVPLPTSILSRVRALAEMHSQSGIEFGPSKIAGYGGRVVQDKGSGFL